MSSFDLPPPDASLPVTPPKRAIGAEKGKEKGVRKKAEKVAEKAIQPLKPQEPGARKISRSRPAKEKSEQAESKQWEKVQESFLKLSLQLSENLAEWHEEWEEPKALSGKTPPLDPSLTKYTQVLRAAKDLISLYESESPKLSGEEKFLFLNKVREELRQIAHAQIDFAGGELHAIQEQVSKSQKAFVAAKEALLNNKGNLRKLTSFYRDVQEKAATLRHVQGQCMAMSEALIDLKEALPANLRPKPQEKGWKVTIGSTIAYVGQGLLHPSTLVPNAEAELADNEERLSREYHELLQNVDKAVKTISYTLHAASMKSSDSSKCDSYFAERLQLLDPQGSALAVLLKEPFTQKDRGPDELLHALAFILAVEEHLPKNSSEQLKENVAASKKLALKALAYEGAPRHPADVFYTNVVSQEHAARRAAFYQEFKVHEVEWRQEFEAGSSDSKIRALNFFFLALHAGEWAHSLQAMRQQGASIAQRAAKLQEELIQGVSPKIQKAAGFLGTVLTDKFHDLQKMSEGELAKFTKRYPETYSLLNKYRTEPQPPTADEIFSIIHAFTMAHLPQQAFVPPQEEVQSVTENHVVQPLNRLEETFQVSAATRTHDLFLVSLAKTLIGLVKGQTPPLHAATRVPPLDYGNKHNNLVKLHDIVASLGIEGVTVPLPFGLASQHVEAFLKKQESVLFDTFHVLAVRYNDFIKEGKSPATFLEEREVIELMTKIQEAIISAFKAAAENPSILETLPEAEQLEEWLTGLRAWGAYLMVRSTGQEDSAVANAGGNLSVNYVSPTLDAVLESAGRVIASYFSIASMRNLLLARVNPFEQSPRLAVTMQELIGEPIGGASNSANIPVSCVLFSNEPYYTGTKLADDRFRALRVSCGFGHGEAVVGNQGMGTDTALVLQSRSNPDELYVLYDNQEKPQRLAPERNSYTGQVSLVPLDNPEDLRERRTLDLSLVRRLFDLGARLEKAFDYPVDSELVIKNGIIYLVQARPINRKELLPTYIDVSKMSKQSQNIEKSLQAKVVVSGVGSAVIVRDPSRILICDTLEKAQDLYKEEQHDLIIIGKDEPANSHPVINFAGLGVPVLYSPDTKEVTQVVAQTGQKKLVLAVCMQEGTLTLWNEESTKADDLTSSGYVSHPAPMSLSLSLAKQPPILKGAVKLYIPPDLSALLYTIRVAETAQVARQALLTLSQHPFVVDASTKTKQLKERVALLGERATPASKLVLEAAEQLEQESARAFRELNATLATDNVSRLEKLLKTKVVQALLLGEFTSKATVSGLSRLSMQEAFAASDLTLQYQEALAQPAQLSSEALLSKQAVGALQEQEWVAFLQELETSVDAKDLSKFRQFLSQLDKVGVMPLWMNLIFAPARQKAKAQDILTKLMSLFFSQKETQVASTRELLKTILDQYDEASQQFLERMGKQREALTAFEKRLSAFADKTSFSPAFQTLKALSENFLSSFAADYKKASPLGKLAAIRMMNEMTGLYDSAVKAMKASGQLATSTRVGVFQMMLEPYFNMLQIWGKEIVGESRFPFVNEWNMGSYFSKIEEILKNRGFGNEQLLPSREFSVAAAMLGSNTAFNRHYPVTLEDVFTLIHQNLLACTSNLSNEMIPTETLKQLAFPAHFLSAINKMDTFRAGIFRAGIQRIGVELSASHLTLQYNIPLRNHSAKLFLTYDEGTGEASIRLQFLGEARDRWQMIADRASLLHLLGHWTLKEEPVVYPLIVEIECALPQNFGASLPPLILDAQDKLLLEFKKMLDFSLNSFYSPSLLNQEEISSIDKKINEFLKTNESPTSKTFTDIKKLLTLAPNYVPPESLIIKFAEDNNSKVREDAVNMIYDRIVSGNVIESIAGLVVKLVNDPEKVVRVNLISKVLPALIDRGIAIDQIVDLAVTLSDDPNADIRHHISSELFGLIIYKGIRTDPIISCILKLGNDSDTLNRGYIASKLFRLIEEGITTDPIINLILKLGNDSDIEIRGIMSKTLSELITKGITTDRAIGRVLRVGYDDSHPFARELISSALFRLIEREITTDPIINLILKLRNDSEAYIRESASKLLSLLESKGITNEHITALEEKLRKDSEL